MAQVGAHDIYSRDAAVYVVSGDEKFETLRRAVEQSGFVQHVLERWQASGKPREQFRIVVKPNIMTASVFEVDSPVYTAPDLVEEIFRCLREEGFGRFSVVESQNVYNYAFTGRNVAAVAAMCGYTGEGYEIVDLSDDPVEVDYGGLLGRHGAGREWLEADYRISFAKNKTHWQCFYTACLKNVYGCLPQWDKMRHYHGKAKSGRNIEFYQATILINDLLPAHFAFLDAWVSGDGLTGHVRDPHPNRTRTIFASQNAYALDWVAGEKMGIDPRENVVIREAIRQWGEIQITRVGDMMPWLPWRNVRPIVIAAFDFIEEYYWLGRFMSRAAATQTDDRFPPVTRFNWLFRICNALVRRAERLLVTVIEPS